MTKYLLITGSRNMSYRMARIAWKVIRNVAKRNDVYVLVGDADGIDWVVIQACDKLGVGVSVFGAYGRMRHSTLTGYNHPLNCTYPERDRYMAKLCYCCLGIWDGFSRGTRITFQEARYLEKPTRVWNDKLDQWMFQDPDRHVV